MADLKISQLTSLNQGDLASNDQLAIVDVDSTETKKITSAALIAGGLTILSDGTIPVSKLVDGTARQLLQTNAAGTSVEFASNIDIPGTLDVTGAATFDDAVTIQGDLTTASDITLQNQKDLRFGEATANGTNYVGFQAPASIAANLTWTLPATDGTAAQVLSTNGSGTLGWSTPSVDTPILESQQTISVNYTLTTGYNGVSAGPVEVADTYTVTVPVGALWVIV
jgi:hypothetical protein